MGGNLVGAGRMTPDEFKRKCNTLLSNLSPLTETLHLSTPPHYRQKESFGDIDVLVAQKDGADARLKSKLVELGVTEFYDSKGRDDLNFSIEFDGVQVDFIFFPESTYEFAKHYLSYNSLGMVIGMMCRSLGFRLTTNGLFFSIYHPLRITECLEHLLITDDFKQVLKFVELDPDKHASGFDTMQEMHEYIVASPRFSSTLFTLGEMNHNRRRKLKNNGMYIEIKKYLENKPQFARETLSSDVSIVRAYQYFPNFKARRKKIIDSALKADEQRQRLSREDKQILFSLVEVDYDSRKAFLDNITPMALADPSFARLDELGKKDWFVKHALLLD